MKDLLTVRHIEITISSPLKKSVWLLCLFTLLLGVFANPVFAQAPSGKPRLILVLVADQFAYQYLSSFQDKFTTGGFNYLMDHGAQFTNCRYEQANTVTAVGHSIISTGAYPWATGIVGNEWYDRKRSKTIEAVFDESATLVGGTGSAGSCHYMYGTTFADEMKLASNGRSKVVSLSLKDRSAIFLAGKSADSVLFFDSKSGSFLSTSAYGRGIPAWVTAFNEQKYADRYFGKPWQRLLPEAQYTASTIDDYQYEHALPGDGKVFPHMITGGVQAPAEAFYKVFSITPWANQMVVDLAKEAIDKEYLGQRQVPDFLGVCLSAGDGLGHAFGPNSQEVEDCVLRLDQSIASLLEHVDQKVGLNNCLIVFTSDHGVAPIPEFLKERGIDGGRIDPANVKSSLETALSSRLGAGDWIESFEPPNLYLKLDTIDKNKYRQPEVEALAAKMAHSVPGVGDVFGAAQLYQNQLPSSPMVEAVKRSYFWGRSGELYVIPKPGYIFSASNSGTTHGSPYSYDCQVPLLVCGAAIVPGKYAQAVSPADIAPTITSVLGITQPSLCEGKPLSVALSTLRAHPAPPPFETAVPPGAHTSPMLRRHKSDD